MDKQRQNESYTELKKDLKDKYCEIIKSDLDEIRNYVADRATKLFGPDFLDKIEKVENLRSERKRAERDFLKSEEYKTAQKELKVAKNEAKNSTSETEEEANRHLNKAISTITTLNVTIKNRLKPYDEKISALDDEISFIKDVSSYGDYAVPTDWSCNHSYFGQNPHTVKQNVKRTRIRPDKHYVAIVVSDGDNVQWQECHFYRTVDCNNQCVSDHTCIRCPSKS